MALASLANLAVLVFVVTSMLAVGLCLRLSQIIEPLRSTRLMLLALVANFVAVPLLAYFIARVLALPESFTIAIVLLGTGAGAPFLPKLAELAKGNRGFAVGLMVLLMAITIAYMPIVLPLFIPSAHVARWSVAKPLVTIVLVPLLIGLSLRARKEAWAAYVEPYLSRASTIALVLAIILVFAANYDRAIRRLGVNAIIAGVGLLLISLGCGFMLGGPSFNTRSILGLGTAQRDISAALVVAVENFSDPDIVVMLIVVALLGLCIQLPLAFAFGRHAARISARCRALSEVRT